MSFQMKVWGATRKVFSKNNLQVHEIKIDKGGYCSKHYHQSKYNMFIILEGRLLVTMYGDHFEDKVILLPMQDITIPPLIYHRFEALDYTHALEIYWSELHEDDIIREDVGGVRCYAQTSNICP